MDAEVQRAIDRLPRKGIAGVVLRVNYSGGFYLNFTFEKQESANLVLTALHEARPQIPQEPEN